MYLFQRLKDLREYESGRKFGRLSLVCSIYSYLHILTPLHTHTYTPSSHHTPGTSPHTLTPHTHHRGSQKPPGGEGQDSGSSNCCHREGTDDRTKVSHLTDLTRAGCTPYLTLFVAQALQGSGRICSRLQANWSKFNQSDDSTVPPEHHTLHCPILRGQKVTRE